MMVRPIVGAGWLAARLPSDEVRVVDVRWYLGDSGRGRREYEVGHIPGAVFMDLDADLSAPDGPGRHPLPDPEVFAKTLGEYGIANHHLVVAYDDMGGAIAARLWWMLRHIGHPAVSVLDGGYRAWTASGFVSDHGITRFRPEVFVPGEIRDDAVERDALMDQLGQVMLLDARAEPRYRGDVEPIDDAAGHIPTAVNVPYSENLTPEGTFKSPEALAQRYRDLGIEPHTRVVASCGSGVTACHNLLALHVAGLGEPVLYPGSWSDWASAGMPIATGSAPGAAPE
jgi:thiosulfate/3-mercaptopyruvate sulfurtransferase